MACWALNSANKYQLSKCLMPMFQVFIRRTRLNIFGYFTTLNAECVSPHYLIKEKRKEFRKWGMWDFFPLKIQSISVGLCRAAEMSCVNSLGNFLEHGTLVLGNIKFMDAFVKVILNEINRNLWLSHLSNLLPILKMLAFTVRKITWV